MHFVNSMHLINTTSGLIHVMVLKFPPLSVYLGCVMTTPIFLLISPRPTRHMKARSDERSSIM